MKIKVSEASGPVLDWMVAKAEGLKPYAFTERDIGQSKHRALSRWCAINVTPVGHDMFDPSTDWSQGGPIIERVKIHLLSPYGAHPIPSLAKSWLAHCLKAPHLADGWGPAKGHGPTPLIAAMRCFVSSKLGEEVDVPEELL